jgi:hypothetical protein
VPSLVLLVTLCNSAVILVWPFAITWKEFWSSPSANRGRSS